MGTNPYQSPGTSSGEPVSEVPPKKYGYYLVSLGYALLAGLVFATWRLVDLATATGQFDKALAEEYLPWLIPFFVLIPGLSLNAMTKGNPLNIRFSSAVLLMIFLLCTSMMWFMWDSL